MYLLYCDESNLEERAGDFLIYGGLVVEASQAKSLSATIDKVRSDAGVPKDYRFKFNPGPEGFDHQRFIALKRASIEAAVAHKAMLIAYVVLHDIAKDADTARLNGINAVCYHFDCLLNRTKGTGLVLIDRFNDAGNQVDAHLRRKFSIGLTGLPYSDELRLENIVGFHYSTVGQSHFPSLVDIILGSLRFAINAHTRGVKEHLESAGKLLKLIEPLFGREKEGAPVSELSFQFSPKIVKVERHREKYQSLKQFLADAGLETTQPITDERRY